MYNKLELSISEEIKGDIKNNLLSRIIFTYKKLNKEEREILQNLSPEYVSAYYAIYSKINNESQAKNNIVWIKRAYCFLWDELKGWKNLKREWTEIYNKNLIAIRKGLGLDGDEVLNINDITKEEYDDLMYLKEQIDKSDKNKNYVEGLIIGLNEKLIECCKYIENISFEDFCSLVGINKVTADK